MRKRALHGRGRKLVLSTLITLFVLNIAIIQTSPVSGASTVTLGTSGKTQTTITLSWTQSGDSLFSKYELYMSSTGVNGPFTKIYEQTNKAKTTYAVTDLQPETPYWFYIKDVDWLASANSNTYQASTTSNLTLAITSQTATTVSLTWSDSNIYSSEIPFTSYIIQMSTSDSIGPYSTLSTFTDRTQTTYTVTGLSSGRYYIRIQENVGGTYTSYSNIVEVSIIYVSINPNVPTTVELGQQVQFTAFPTGGSGSYIYQWRSNGNQISGATSADFTFQPNSVRELGTQTIDVVVKDASNTNVEANSVPVPVSVRPKPITLSISCSGASMQIGQQIQFTASASGGTESYQFKWYSNGIQTDTTSSTFVFSPTQAGIYNVYAIAEDAQDTSIAAATSNTLSVQVSGASTNQPTNVQPTANPTNSNSQTSDSTYSGLNLTYIIIIVVAIVAVVAVVVGVIMLKKK